MWRGNLRASEEITGHKNEATGRWLQAVMKQVTAITQVLIRNLHLNQADVIVFLSFVKKACGTLALGQARRARWVRSEDV
jgi:hypothetical protein